MIFPDLKRLYRGLNAIDFDDFSTVMKSKLNVSTDYVKNVWPTFQEYPVEFMVGYYPEEVAEAILDLAWKMGADDGG